MTTVKHAPPISNGVAKTPYSPDSAASQGLASCHVCQKLFPATEHICDRCGTHLHVRDTRSLDMTMALLITAALFYIPANIFPIMINEQFGVQTPSTIMGGVLLFIKHESYLVAVVIFSASIVIPMAKMAALCWLCYRVKYGGNMKYHELTRLYRVVEFIGKWSMVDVFVVSVLVGLVQIGALVSIIPDVAIMAFMGVVIFTMFAAHAFDPRLIWDKLEPS